MWYNLDTRFDIHCSNERYEMVQVYACIYMTDIKID